MKSVANHDLHGMPLDSSDGASYNRHYMLCAFTLKRRLAIQERYDHVIRSV